MDKKMVEISEKVRQYEKESPNFQAYQKTHEKVREEDNSFVPSKDFVDTLLKQCATELGIEYDSAD